MNRLVFPMILALSAALPAWADETRGWRAAGPYSGQENNQRVAHYTSPGMQSADFATISFGSGGYFPMALFNLMGDPEGSMQALAEVQRDFAADYQSIADSCDGGGYSGAEAEAYFQLCVMEQLMADGYVSMSFLLDITDLVYADDPVVRLSAFGIRNEAEGRFVPMMSLPQGEICGGEEEESLCAACFASLRALAAGDAGAACGVDGMDHTLIAADVSAPWFGFLLFMARNEADLGPWKIAVQLQRRSGATYDVSYTSDDLMAALFGPGG